MEGEDKHALEGVEDGEEVSQHHGRLADEEQPERPGQAQETEESEAAHDPRP